MPGTRPLLCAIAAFAYVQTRKPSDERCGRAARAAADVARARARAVRRSCAASRKSAPWKAKSASVVRPPNSAYGSSRSSRLPVKSPVRVRSGTPCDDVGERDAPEQRRHGARARRGSCPSGARHCASGSLVAVLDRDAADDQADEHEEEREVEAGEERRVPAGEGGERRAAGDEQPDLVAVPDRADRADERAALAARLGRRTAAACRRRSRIPRARSSRSRGRRSGRTRASARFQ